MAPGAATVDNESLEIAETVEDDFDNLAGAILLSNWARTSLRVPTGQPLSDGGMEEALPPEASILEDR